jgi:hypothetical protein
MLTKKERKRRKIEHARRQRQAAQTEPRCPICGRETVQLADGRRQCLAVACGLITDDDPDEGGDYGNDPTRRMMRQEERAKDGQF